MDGDQAVSKDLVTFTGVLECIPSSLAGARFPADCRAGDVRQGAKTQEAERENAPRRVQKHAKGQGESLVLSISCGLSVKSHIPGHK